MPDDYSIYWKKGGDELIKSEKYDEAIKCYIEAIKN